MVETDYTKLVPRTPPEGLLEWALEGGALKKAGLVYHKEWAEDHSISAILEDSCRKVPIVSAVCSACGAVISRPWISGSSTYGFLTEEDRVVAEHGDDWDCPCCDSEVSVLLKSKIPRSGKDTDECFVTSASVLDGKPGERPLVLTQWWLQRLTTREAETKYTVAPVSAYVFEAEDACWLRGWKKSYSGHSGYFMVATREWSQPKVWADEMGNVGRIFGLTKELVEESCLSNSKLDLFMEQDGFGTVPVGYLRLYQKYPQVENLVVQGVGHILVRMFAELMDSDAWEKNNRGLAPMPPELHLEEKRPAQMLGLNKDELRVMVEQHWDLYHWRVYVKAKAAGDRMTLPGDIELVHRYGAEDVEKIIGLAPVGKTMRYLLKQIERLGMEMEEQEHDPFDEYDDYDDDFTGLANASYLADYWQMATVAGWNLEDPEVRWPKDLISAHNRAMDASQVVLNRNQQKAIRKRAKALADFSYVSGGLMIFPAGSQTALTEEGAKLHHCVAGYGKDIASGSTSIFFIRHTWAPKEPYFTLEYKDGKVEQNRGLHNCSRTKEVKDFEASWLAWIKKGRPRNTGGTPKGAAPAVTEIPKTRRM